MTGEKLKDLFTTPKVRRYRVSRRRMIFEHLNKIKMNKFIEKMMELGAAEDQCAFEAGRKAILEEAEKIYNEHFYKVLLAGELALSARMVTTSNAKNLSKRIEEMEADLNAYDNEIMKD